MSRPVISVEGLSKAYRIGLKDEIPDSLVGAVQGMIKAPWKNWRRLSRLNTFSHQQEGDDLFWALRDLSFEVQEGEVVGVIGRNGAGKSTLLKILSRITEPTSGRAVIRGRVSSLLEVGTGFHPELTGRENIYMNGTMLGMTKREIDRKFDEIVDFSGVEKFLDTPIKRYSSGMKVRLAFAVAAHLEPEILIIDEVLAVGDAEFQKKCLGKMHAVAQCGRTVLFVSHNMAAVENLCTAGICLAEGRVIQLGSAKEAITSYLSSVVSATDVILRRSAGMKHIVQDVLLHIEDGTFSSVVRCGSRFIIQIKYNSTAALHRARIGLRIESLAGTPITHLQSEIATGGLLELNRSGIAACAIERLPLLPGVYRLVVAVFSQGVLIDHLDPALEFQVEPGDYFGTGRLPDTSLGCVLVQSQWSVGPAA